MPLSMPEKHLPFALIVLIGLASACQHSPGVHSEIEQLKTSIRERYQDGDTTLISEIQLREFWPANHSNWLSADAAVRTYDHARRPFKMAEKSYHQGGEIFLGASLGDYAQDSSALLLLRKEWPTVSYLNYLPGKKLPIQGSRFTTESSRGISQLDIIIDGRYLLSLQTNHPEGERNVLGFANQLHWEKLTRN